MIRLLTLFFFLSLIISKNYCQGSDLSLAELIAFNDDKLAKAKEFIDADTSTARIFLNEISLDLPEISDSLFQVYTNKKLDFFYNYFSEDDLLKELMRSIELAKERNDSISLAQFHNELAEVFLNVSNFKEALKSTLISLAIYDAQGNQDKVGELLLKKGAIEYAIGDYVNSIETVFHAADKFKESGSKFHLAFSYLQIGITYLYIEQFQKSIAN